MLRQGDQAVVAHVPRDVVPDRLLAAARRVAAGGFTRRLGRKDTAVSPQRGRTAAGRRGGRGTRACCSAPAASRGGGTPRWLGAYHTNSALVLGAAELLLLATVMGRTEGRRPCCVSRSMLLLRPQPAGAGAAPGRPSRRRCRRRVAAAWLPVIGAVVGRGRHTRAAGCCWRSARRSELVGAALLILLGAVVDPLRDRAAAASADRRLRPR